MFTIDTYGREMHRGTQWRALFSDEELRIWKGRFTEMRQRGHAFMVLLWSVIGYWLLLEVAWLWEKSVICPLRQPLKRRIAEDSLLVATPVAGAVRLPSQQERQNTTTEHLLQVCCISFICSHTGTHTHTHCREHFSDSFSWSDN